MPVCTRKKLIEVALPLVAINVASAREKSIRHGHSSTLHLWWARRPLAAARAVIFAQMVDDPSSWPDLFPTEKAQEKERARLFRVIEDLVKWENTTNEMVLQQARDEIWQSWRRACAENADHPRAKELFDRHKLPAFHDPFAGGGSLPLEAQRLGLEAYASDLNPVAVLINKAMIEIPPKFAGKPPVNPDAQAELTGGAHWNGTGAQGLATDVRYYGKWMRDEAEKRIGHLYPKVTVTAQMANDRPDLKPLVGQDLTVIAWLWARTVKSPNPAFAGVDVPLASTFLLSTKVGKEAYVEPVLENVQTAPMDLAPSRGDLVGRAQLMAGKPGYRFAVKVGKPKDAEVAKNGTKLARGANFKCLMSGTPIAPDHIYGEAKAGRMGARLMAVVAEGAHGRIYLAPTPEHEAVASIAKPEWKPDVEMPENPRWFSPPLYGLMTFGDLFTDRQIVALTTFSDLVGEAMARARHDAIAAGLPDDSERLRDDGIGATAYAEAVSVYLACGISRSADFWSNLCIWANQPKNEIVAHLFGRQAIPMAWDFAEASPFSESGGNFTKNLAYVARGVEFLPATVTSKAAQLDAATNRLSADKMVSTDPPYYDNIGYADLSDYFYVWLRRSLRGVFPDLFATLAVPKAEELVATPYRHGGKDRAEMFFLKGMTQAMHRVAEQAHPAFPVTIYYAFKQSETESDVGTASTGWDTFLDAVIQAGFGISGTWPMRTERTQGLKGETNALASCIVLVCRQRTLDAPTATRRDFVAALKAELPAALRHLQAGNIAPVDLAQAAIGPGMGVYTRYARVLDAEGNRVPVREALALINATLDEALTEQEGDFDADSRWALAWFEQNGFAEGEYGVAETLSKAKNTSVQAMTGKDGILDSGRGKVRPRKPEELPADWDPATDPRLTAWEVVHHLIRALGAGGEAAAADLVAKLGARAEAARELAYRLYTLCERKKRAAEALAYNGLVQSWPEIARLAHEGAVQGRAQADLLDVV
jgi:putative DNA methylase